MEVLVTVVRGATALYLDANGPTAGSGVVNGLYYWDWGSPQWSSDPAGTTAPGIWQPGAKLVLCAGNDATATYNLTALDRMTADAIAAEEGVATIGGSKLTLNGGGLDVSAGAKLTVQASLTGGTITKSGAGSVTLASPGNAFTGGIAVVGGALEAAAETSSLPGASTPTGQVPAAVVANYLRLDGGTFRQPGTGKSVTLLTSRKGIWLGAGGGTLDITNATTGSQHTYGGVIGGPGGLTKSGPGILVLSGTSTYAGVTTVSGGTLRLGASDVLPATTAVHVDAGASLDLGLFSQSVAALSGDGLVSAALGSGGTFTFGDGSSTTYSGNIGYGNSQTSSGLALVKQGTGTVTLAGGTSLLTRGTTTIAAGTLRLGTPGSGIGDQSPVVINAGATYDMNGLPDTIGRLSGTGRIINAGTLQVTGDGESTWAGTISGTGGLSRVGTGYLVIAAPQTYTGPTAMWSEDEYGVGMRLGTNNALPAGELQLDDRGGTGVTLDLNGFNQTFASVTSAYAGTGTPVITSQSATPATLTINATSNVTLDAVLKGALALSKAGPGTLTLKRDNEQTSVTRVLAGTLQIGDGGNAGSVPGDIINSDSLVFARADSVTCGGTISGTGSLTQAGSGNLLLAGANTYTGKTTVQAGVLTITAGANLGAGGAGNTLVLDGGALRLAAPVTMSRGLTVAPGGGTIDTAQFDATFSGTLSGTGQLTKSGPGQLTLRPVAMGELVAADGTVVLAASAGTAQIRTLTLQGGRVDISTARVVLAASAPSVVRQGLYSGRWDSGADDWAGNGLVSSAAAADPTATTAIAYATAGQLGVTTWGGIAGLAPTTVVLKYAYYGDLNLDGKVTADDYARIDRSLARGGLAGTAVWIDGDVDYDGTVTATDYLLMDRAFARHGGVLDPATLAAREAQFGPAYVAKLTAAIPDPAGAPSLALLALAGMRRWRRNP